MRSLAFLLSATFVASATLLPAQEFQPRSIEFQGAPEYSDQELLAAAQLKPGMSLTVDAMKDHAKTLLDTGVFESINFQFTGVDLRYLLTPSANLYPIHLTNIPLQAGKELDAKIHDRVPLYHGKVPADSGLTERVRAALEQILNQNFAAQGVAFTVQTVSNASAAPGAAPAINFSIASPPVIVGEIHSDSKSPALSPSASQVLLKLTGQPYDADGSLSQITTYLGNDYHDRGYLEAHVEPKALAPRATVGKIEIPFVVSFTPGMQYHLGEIRFAPDLLASHAEFDRQSALHFGDTAAGQKLTDEWQYIARQYHNHGYMQASIHPTPTFDRFKGIVSFDVTADPGPVYTMGNVNIENVTDDLRAAILAKWPTPTGAVFNEGAVRSFFAVTTVGGPQSALERVFAAVNVDYTQQLNDDTHTVDLTVRLEKKH
jgi:outer membrane protein assembly factor BamA